MLTIGGLPSGYCGPQNLRTDSMLRRHRANGASSRWPRTSVDPPGPPRSAPSAWSNPASTGGYYLCFSSMVVLEEDSGDMRVWDLVPVPRIAGA